ncbi:potassium channel family protein [Clostridiisalibacter paucivorans]|uniref:potassium channel family protein n=1 Tax=Clostridiisalibacter paucivorans TaxID=408753 RepID=UPI00047906FC|nr:potassium channel protein [Clostridiisalibacter paucivorans]
MKDTRKFVVISMAFMTLIIASTIGYKRLLGVNIIDALYMTIITISTVGYSEVADMTTDAKLFSIFVIFSGLGIAGYTFTSIVSLFLEGEFKNAWRRKRMESKISRLNNHYILCGAGETGHSVIQQFLKSDVSFIVIEKNEDKVRELMENGILAVQGDATQEDVLEKANIKTAKGLISSLSSDADNVFTVLTARQINKRLYIVSRAIEKNSPEKLKKAGANNTISPNEIGGRRMAAIVLRPSIISFLDVITHAGDVILDLEDVVVCKGSDMLGKSLKEVKIPEKIGLIVLAMRKNGQERLMFNPSSDEVLELDDVMIVLGTEEQVNDLRRLACDNGERELLF